MMRLQPVLRCLRLFMPVNLRWGPQMFSQVTAHSLWLLALSSGGIPAQLQAQASRGIVCLELHCSPLAFMWLCFNY